MHSGYAFKLWLQHPGLLAAEQHQVIDAIGSRPGDDALQLPYL